jgi:PIN domain nuclease of toxin-antitoxin system
LKLLFDTHVVLWAFDDPSVLSPAMLEAMRRRTPIVVSVASLWEIALKMARGKLSVPEDLPQRLVAAGFEILPVSAQHAWDVRSTPNPLATADPFDRILFCQAQREGLTLATRDDALLRSGAAVIRA